MTAPTTPAGMPEQDWKNIDEYAPFHPDASHINPDYRDGWNACYEAGRTAQAGEIVAWEWYTPVRGGTWRGNLGYSRPTSCVGYTNVRPLYAAAPAASAK